MKKIKIGILGYGNIGRGVEAAIKQNSDMELVGIYTRREPSKVGVQTPNVKVYTAAELNKAQDIDVLILCGGSATDLPVQSPKYAEKYNIVDSFDNHSMIPEHFDALDNAARKGKKVATMSIGWDPGLFSLNRAVAIAALPKGETYTFWGKGVSQGHSDAIRRIDGVKDARQYTIPIDKALAKVRSGENPTLTTREKHTRECFVVTEKNADLKRIEKEIVTMPAYFDGYNTRVSFISEEELRRDHSGIPHGGIVIRTGKTGWMEENTEIYEFKLKLESNPDFCSSVMVSYARATYRMAKEGLIGCKTIFDIPISYTSIFTPEEMRKKLL